MEKTFKLALDKVLSEKIFKNELALCTAAGVDQGGVNKFLKTVRYRLGKAAAPDKLKDNLNLDVVGKLVDTMGGILIFPWDKETSNDALEAAKLKKELVEAKERIIALEKELYACEKVNSSYEAIIRDKFGNTPDSQPIQPLKKPAS